MTVGVGLLTLIGAVISREPGLVLLVGGVLAAGVWLLWPQTDAPILLLPFALQWLPVAVKPLQSALTGRPLDDLADFGAHLTPAALFGLAGVGALGLGMWLGSGRHRIDWSESLDHNAARWPARTVAPLALVLIIGGDILTVASNFAGPAHQILLAFGAARNAGLFILAYWCLSQRRGLGLLAIVVTSEVVFGLTGFFAGFRESLLVLLVAAAAARPKLSLGGLAGVGLALTLLMTITVFWTAIKPDYRLFLNGGSHQQVVVQPLPERVAYIAKAVAKFNADDFGRGVRDLVSRASYIDFLADTLANVPTVIQHENGKRLGRAVLNMATPRIFFPDKPPTPNDSEVTAYYTGRTLDLTGASSVSIGYLGELYIDFGYLGALVGAILIGMTGGWAYDTLRGYQGVPILLSYGVAIMAMVPFSIFESDMVRFFGSAVTVFAACLVIQRWLAPPALALLTGRRLRIEA